MFSIQQIIRHLEPSELNICLPSDLPESDRLPREGPLNSWNLSLLEISLLESGNTLWNLGKYFLGARRELNLFPVFEPLWNLPPSVRKYFPDLEMDFSATIRIPGNWELTYVSQRLSFHVICILKHIPQRVKELSWSRKIYVNSHLARKFPSILYLITCRLSFTVIPFQIFR